MLSSPSSQLRFPSHHCWRKCIRPLSGPVRVYESSRVPFSRGRRNQAIQKTPRFQRFKTLLEERESPRSRTERGKVFGHRCWILEVIWVVIPSISSQSLTLWDLRECTNPHSLDTAFLGSILACLPSLLRPTHKTVMWNGSETLQRGSFLDHVDALYPTSSLIETH